uniref:Protein HGH1 homolog n=1 Tax=Mesocestoides corti TaxID=53468 RepID=A0A5K3FS86_MESCO
MEQAGLLEALLQVSTDEASTREITEELSHYFDILTGVIVESAQSMSSSALSSDRMFQLSIKCLINFCANEVLALQLFNSCDEQRREKFLGALISLTLSDAEGDIKTLTSSLLVNLTVVSEWAAALCDKSYVTSIYKKVATKRKPSRTELQFILNLTAISKMRQCICDELDCLSLLVCLLRELNDASSRLSIAGIVKNCCFEERYHGKICSDEEDILCNLLVVLCGPEDNIDADDLLNLPPLIREAYHSQTVKRESDTSVKFTICEALMQLCSTEVGRSHLRRLRAYFILRELHRHECAVEGRIADAQKEQKRVQRILIFTIEQIVDQLLCEEADRPRGLRSLRDVSVDAEVQNRLEKAKDDYLNVA